MQLQVGKNGEQPGSHNPSTGEITGLTDLFTHLSHVEHSANFVNALKNEPDPEKRAELVADLLATYQHLPEPIKNDILDYVRTPNQVTVDKIKQHACNEVQRIWDYLGVC